MVAQLAYWGFRQKPCTDYMRYAYLHLGSDADAEEAVDLTFDQVMDRWLRMLQMENLEGHAWTILKRRIIDMHRKRRRRPELMETAAFEAALAGHPDDPYVPGEAAAAGVVDLCARTGISVRMCIQCLAPSPPSPAHNPRMSRRPSTVTARAT